jgi:phosphohistidine phosphatase
LKTLWLLRHADASPAAIHQDDRDRTLNARGLAACDSLAALLAKRAPIAGLVLCSTAERAQQTWSRLEHAFRAARLELADDLYLASDDALLERLWAVEDGIAQVLVVAHNPGLQRLAARLAGGGDEWALQRVGRGFPAAALAELHFDVDRWSRIRERAGSLARFVTPGSS